MDIKDLEKLLETTDDKYAVLSNKSNLISYKITLEQLKDLLGKFLSDESKKRFILENPYGYNVVTLTDLLGILSVDTLSEILKNNKEFLQEKKILTYEIIKRLKTEDQLKFVSIMENVGLSLEEKRKILVYLNPDTKEKIDKSNLSYEYKTALEMHVEDDFKNIETIGKIIVDFNKDLEIYRGLDDIIAINALKIREEDKEKLLQLCDICPNMIIRDNLMIGQSTAQEYKNAEKWIDSVIQEINPNWSDVEKVAYIDSTIGKKISYTPDFGTELFEAGDARALWKIIDSGYGVCNGIAQVEKYILEKLGIKSEIISSNKHSFLRLKDISLPTKNGEFVVGDTLLDPTWNLSNNRYGAMPPYFCVSYEQIRSQDINKYGTDTQCHKNDNLSDVTLSLDEEMLRNAFKTIGLAGKDGYFPIKALFDKSEEVDKSMPIEEEQISRQLDVLKEYYPNFAMLLDNAFK